MKQGVCVYIYSISQKPLWVRLCQGVLFQVVWNGDCRSEMFYWWDKFPDTQPAVLRQ